MEPHPGDLWSAVIAMVSVVVTGVASIWIAIIRARVETQVAAKKTAENTAGEVAELAESIIRLREEENRILRQQKEDLARELEQYRDEESESHG